MTNNHVIFSGDSAGNVYGGRTKFNPDPSNTVEVTGNTVEISRGTVNYVVGGSSADNPGAIATVADNVVTIKGGTINGMVGGGETTAGTATDNAVTLEGGTINGIVVGGMANTGTATDNTVTFKGGTINNGMVIGGIAITGNTIRNTVIIDGPVTFSAVDHLLGGYCIDDFDECGTDTFTGNTLSKKSDTTGTPQLTVNFQFINFDYNGDANLGELDTTPYGSSESDVTIDVNEARTINFDGKITGQGGITKKGAGTLMLRSGTNNDYEGGTTIEKGLINFDDIGAFGDTSVNKITLDGGGLQWAEVYTGGDISDRLEIGEKGSTFHTNDNDVIFDKPITGVPGDGGITKDGLGTLTFNQASDYTGMTIVKAGTLALAGSGTISSLLTLHAGAEFADGGDSPSQLTRLDVHGGAKTATYTGDLIVNNISAGSLNFYLPDDISESSPPLLTVDGAVILTGNTIGLYLYDDSSGLASLASLGPEETITITLIDGQAGTDFGSIPKISTITNAARTHTYESELKIDEGKHDLLISIGGKSGTAPTPEPPMKALAESGLAVTVLLNQGADFLIDRGIAAALGTA
ncbi:MAG: autotransporter-associated beta strand repeat-containing protein, partial [Candidatus Accumulibacter sp.]|nr:autotransporter-associated beta strand repeat-containing protein [Accumulibacter sp.]